MIRRELAAFGAAVRYFTRLPWPGGTHAAADLGEAARHLPAVGLLVGGLSGLAFWLGEMLWPRSVALLLALAVGLYVTGAFHEDGLADTADGLGGGWDKARILAIMKDSRIGSFGVIALGLALLARYVLLLELHEFSLPLVLLAGHALSRWLATWVLARYDYVRSDDSSKARPLTRTPGAAGLVWGALCVALPLCGLPLLPVLGGVLLAALAAGWLLRLSLRWLGGYSGDVLGAIQQLAELGFYLGLLAQLPG
ncbi:MAG: hypothetical protein RIR00_1922 [Pseudomonadota bacterium]